MGSAIASDTQATHIPASAELTMKRRRRRRQEEEGGDKTRQDTTLGGRSASQHVTSKTSAPEWPLQATSHGIQPLRARPSARAPTRPKARAYALEGGGGTANTHRLMANLGPNQNCTKKYLDSGLAFARGLGLETCRPCAINLRESPGTPSRA